MCQYILYSLNTIKIVVIAYHIKNSLSKNLGKTKKNTRTYRFVLEITILKRYGITSEKYV